MKTRTLLLAGITVISSLILSSCEDWGVNCIRGNDHFISEERITPEFSGVEVSGSFDVTIDTGSETSVYVEADENLMDYIVTSVRGHKLVIETEHNKCLKSHNPISVYVTTPELYDVELNGSGSIDCGELTTSELDADIEGSGVIDLAYVNADEVTLNISGSGSIKGVIDVYSLKAEVDGSGDIRIDDGTAHNADLNVNGSGRIRAENMDIDNCYVEINGSGDVYAFVYDLLDVTISGSGTMYYYGNPAEIVKKIYGSGRLVKR